MQFRLFFIFVLYIFSSSLSLADKRVALVIGNSDYKHEARLNNPVNDAKKLKDLLLKNKFDKVIYKQNQTLKQLRQALREFRKSAKGSEISLVYFSGHGLEISGKNYIIPIDAELKHDEDVQYEAVSLQTVLNSTRGASKLQIIILDACRINPFNRKMIRSAGLTRSVTRGYVPVAPTGNVIVAYAAKAGTVAYDGQGKNSPFAEALFQHALKPGLDVRLAFGYIRDQVLKSTDEKQEPWLYGSLGGNVISLVPGNNSNRELRKELEALRAQLKKQQNNKVQTAQVPKLPKVEAKPIKQNTVGVFEDKLKHGHIFKDCDDCPSMIVVKGGSFMMGSNDYDSENPIHQVTIPKLAVGRYEITFNEWDACVRAGGCLHKLDDEGWGRVNRPVINVSWSDAKAYVAWLSKKAGKPYRLLTEAEWEYVARAGTDTKYSFGNSVSKTVANYSFYVGRTSKVGSYKANRWGLYDVHGNVWEWVEDCWHEDYKNAPRDGRAWLKENGSDCSRRVLRGGSWYSVPGSLRSAHRHWNNSTSRDFYTGFRITRTLGSANR